MAELQAELLARAAAWLKPGGTLVYATCSLEQAEGEDQVARFLDARPDFGPLPALPAELPAGIAPTAQGWVRNPPAILATQAGTDGFFFDRIQRSTNH